MSRLAARATVSCGMCPVVDVVVTLKPTSYAFFVREREHGIQGRVSPVLLRVVSCAGLFGSRQSAPQLDTSKKQWRSYKIGPAKGAQVLQVLQASQCRHSGQLEPQDGAVVAIECLLSIVDTHPTCMTRC